MKERPILFSGEMVRAILDGRKTQTRRVIKPLPTWATDQWEWCPPAWFQKKYDMSGHGFITWKDKSNLLAECCPYGQPGDVLIGRETWQYWNWTEDGMPYIRYAADEYVSPPINYPENCVDQVTDVWAKLSDHWNYDIDGAARDRYWRPSIHMPHWASRIRQTITSVRVERLQDISGEDACAEGLNYTPCGCECCAMTSAMCSADASGMIMEYSELWNSIYAKRGLGWDVNPWCWILEYEAYKP